MTSIALPDELWGFIVYEIPDNPVTIREMIYSRRLVEVVEIFTEDEP